MGGSISTGISTTPGHMCDINAIVHPTDDYNPISVFKFPVLNNDFLHDSVLNKDSMNDSVLNKDSMNDSVLNASEITHTPAATTTITADASGKKERFRFSKQHRALLTQMFDDDPKPCKTLIYQVAISIQHTEGQVKTFGNNYRKDKKNPDARKSAKKRKTLFQLTRENTTNAVLV